MSYTPSIREQILANFATRFTNAKMGDLITAPDGSQWPLTQTWNLILRHIPAQTDIKAGKCIAILVGKETAERAIGFDTKYMRVVFEFYDNVAIGDIVSTEQNRILLDLQMMILTDKTCGGLTLDIVEVMNECGIEGPAEKVMAGMIEVKIMYRHRAGNPRLQK